MGLFDKDKEAFGPVESDLLDMRFGDPAFMRPYWKSFKTEIIVGDGQDMGYLNAYGSESLKQTIKDIHNKVGNAAADDKYIVIGIGASQMISAALYALGLEEVWVKPPYFSRFEQFSQFAGIGIKFIKSELPPVPGEFVEIVTNPNNPDGNRNDFPVTSTVIHDLVYNWPQYDDVVRYDEDIMVFGLAKATGHASTRVGWALVRDKYIADRMQHYIEMSVGVESLKMCERVLRHQFIVEPQFTCFKHGKDKLRRRREKLNEASKGKKLKILNNKGMFVWGRIEGENASEYFAKTYGILVVNGSYFGMSDDSYFRMNLGVDVDTFESLIEKLSV
jgi:aspartate/methionine/tyrosine aminotransferase